MQHSEKLDQLSAALTKVQAGLAPALKDRKANYGTYADLSSVWDACRQSLTDNGLSVAQGLGRDDKDGYLWTTLLHSSGQFITGECPLILAKRDPQAVGAAVTYYRRYSLAAMLGVTQEDDDAQGAMPKSKPAEQPKAATPPPASAFTIYRAGLRACATIDELAAEFGKTKADKSKMTAEEFEQLTNLKDKLKTSLTPKAA